MTHTPQVSSIHSTRSASRGFRTVVLGLLSLFAIFATASAGAVVIPPAATKAFDPAFVAVGGVTRMRITLKNNNATSVLTGVAFTDSYPTGMANAPNNVLVSNTCNGMATADPNGTVTKLTGGSIAAGQSCEIDVNVTGTQQGAGQTLVNHTGPVTASQTLAGADATATLLVQNAPPIPAPIVTLSAMPDGIAVGGTGTLMITLSNWNVVPIAGVQVTLNYPAPLNIANAATDVLQDESLCSTGHDVATPGGSGIAIAGATIPPGSTCVYFVSVVGTAPGPSALDTGPVISANASPSAGATATLTVASSSLAPAPTVQETITPASIKVGGTAQILITLINNDPSNPITGVHLQGVYGLGLANAPNGLVSNTCSGLPILHPHDGVFEADFVLINGTIPGGGNCTVTINAVGGIGGGITPTEFVSNDTNGNAQAGGFTSASVAVVDGALLDAPSATKQFAPPSVAVGGTSDMTIQLTNNDPFLPITGAQFMDNYPDGMTNVSSGTIVEENTCGGTVTANADGNSAALANGTIPPGGCTVVIKVVGKSPGLWVNQTGAIPAGNALTGATAFGGLFVDQAGAIAPPTVTKSFAPQSIAVGDGSVMTITLTNNDASTPITGAAFTDPYPGGMANAPSNVIDNTTDCVGTVTAPQNGQQVVLTNGTIPAGASCKIVIHVVGTAPGTILNETAPVTSTNATTSASASATVDIAPASGGAPQTITFTSTAPASAVVGGPAYVATATASSNLPVVLTIDASSSLVCTISNGAVTFTGAGTCTIDANQGGNANFAPAAQVQQPFAVAAPSGGASQTITFTSTAPANATAGGSTYLATATATSNLPVSMTIDAASVTVCSINSGLVSFVGAGTCTIDANQGGNGSYAPAAQTQQFFPVAPAGGAASQTIGFSSTPPSNATVGGPMYFATATATSGLPVLLTIDGTSANVCTINAGTVAFIGAGTCTIDANQGGGTNNGTNFAAAPQMQQSFAVAGAGGQTPQAITFTSTPPNNATVGSPSYPATATATSGLPVVLTIDGTSATVCTINAGMVSFIAAGTCTIDANQGGGTNNGTDFAAAPQVQQPFAVGSGGGAATQTIAFTSSAPNNAKVAGPMYLVGATATSGLPVSF